MNYSDEIIKLYNDEIYLLRKQISVPYNESDMIKSQLKYLNSILNKQVRLMFISDIRKYFENMQKNECCKEEDNMLDNNSKEIFLKMKRKIQNSANNDHTITFMILGFLDELDRTLLQSVRNHILEFVSTLAFTLNKLTGMNFPSVQSEGNIQ